MAKTLKIAPNLYHKGPKTGTPSTGWDFRQMEVTKAEMEVAAANNAILALGILPAGHRLQNLFVECDPLSTGADIVFDVGILNSYYNTAPASATTPGIDGSTTVSELEDSSITLTDGTVIAYTNIITGATIGRSSAAGRCALDNAAAALAPSLIGVGVDKLHDRIIAINFTTEATTGVAGTIALGVCSAED